MALSKQRKQELVETYTELLQRSQGVVWVNNKGLSVSEISALRHRPREAEGVCRVTKNRLTRLALQEAGLPATEDTLSGPTLVGFAFGEIPPVAKAISDFAKENDTIEIKGGMMGTQLLSAQEVKTLANLPPLPELTPMPSVSATMALTLPTGIPNSSAAIMARDIRVPERSGDPSTTVAEPSGFMLITTLDCMPALNQKPHATPLP